MDTSTLLTLSKQYLADTYNRFPIVLVRGVGSRVWDSDGKEYLDCVAGLAVNNLGHCHPRVVEAIRQQGEQLLHVSNLYHSIPQIRLAQLLVERSFADKVFFCNSGAEANEAAIKLARKYAKEHRGQDCFEIITMHNSFHGRTLATLTATGQEKFHKGFEPLLPGFIQVPFNDVEAVKRAIGPRTCAVLTEVIQGEGGVNVPDEGYLAALRQLCHEHRLLLVLDEVQTGMGRTGKPFAYEHYGIAPDIMTLAKSLGGGLAIGAMLCTAEVASAFTPGSHASTFGGNPLACAAGVAALQTLLQEGLPERCGVVGRYFLDRLVALQPRHRCVRQVRGKGLILAMELKGEGAAIVSACLERGILINCTMGTVLRFLPPLIIETGEIDRVVDTLDDLLRGMDHA